MNTFFRVSLAAVMLLTLQGTAVAANTQRPAVTSVTAQVSEAGFQHHYVKVAGQKIHYDGGKRGARVADPGLAANLVCLASCDDRTRRRRLYGDSG
ncbi:hypothetical protein [Aeromonas sp. Marseille-Q7275]